MPTLLRLEAWLESMRGPDGYGGPVCHWWQDCLEYTGAGLDWRYEGIITGYLNLFERTDQTVWLEKAQRAGNDLVKGQLAEGNFRNSSFEANPKPGGTPHEAACDLALIRLARALRKQNLAGWEPYAQAAERNLRNYILGQLWVREGGYFCNYVGDRIFVPNKAATIVEAILAWEEFSEMDEWTHTYALPTLDRICACQRRQPGKLLNGAIDQAQGIRRREGWFFPFYNARCIPALMLGYQVSGQERYLETAKAAMDFILRVRLEDGSFPQAIRANRRTCRYPQWIAGTGSILQAMECLEAFYPPGDRSPTLEWMLRGMLPSGGIRAAHGFAHKDPGWRFSELPDFRDLLAVSGWADKVFCFLTSLVSEEIGADVPELLPFEEPCEYDRRRCIYYEDGQRIEIRYKKKVLYRWEKGISWAEIVRSRKI